jgi:hypothetical protein
VAAASRLGRQLEEVIASLSKVDARFALIGGLALDFRLFNREALLEEILK